MSKPKLIRAALRRHKRTGHWHLKITQGGRVLAAGEYDSLATAHEACLRLYRDAHKALHTLFKKENLR